MNVKGWTSKAGATLLAVLMAGSLVGCKFLKREKKPFGETCITDLDCESLQCSTTGNICSKACTYDKDCGGDLVCRRKDDNTGNQCSTAVGTPANGACMNTWDCQHNACLHYVGKEDQPGLCTKYCQTSDDCPAGEKICEKISDTGMLKVCLPGDPKADPSTRPQVAPVPVTPKGTPAPKYTPRPVAHPTPPPRHDPPPPPPPDKKPPPKKKK
jgi:hypothetical protein